MPINPALRNEWIAAGYKSDMGSAVPCSPPAQPSAIRLYNLTSAQHALSNIENGRIKVSRFADLNDRTQVEFINENVDHSHCIFFGNVIVQALRQHRDLRPSLTFNESLHDRPHYDLDDQKMRQLRVFSHSLGRLPTVAKG
jgi:hypothetical protein